MILDDGYFDKTRDRLEGLVAGDSAVGKRMFDIPPGLLASLKGLCTVLIDEWEEHVQRVKAGVAVDLSEDKPIDCLDDHSQDGLWSQFAMEVERMIWFRLVDMGGGFTDREITEMATAIHGRKVEHDNFTGLDCCE